MNIENMTELELAQYEADQCRMRYIITKQTVGQSDDTIAYLQTLMERAFANVEMIEQEA